MRLSIAFISIKLTGFVIIDDDKSLDELADLFKENLIQTSSYIGVTAKH